MRLCKAHFTDRDGTRKKGRLGAEAESFVDPQAGAVEQAVDQRHNRAGVGEHLIPHGEGLVGGQDNGTLLVAPPDYLKEQIRGPAVVVA